jgi:glyoxylase-like metal-dependent hydrolase (beta-lactamase superfamily II)
MQRAVDEWSRFRIVVPPLTFDSGLRLYRDDLTIDIRHIGGPHATDSVIVRVGDVLFLGDAHLQPDHTPARTVIERLLSDETTQTFVTARDSTPLSRAEFAALLD